MADRDPELSAVLLVDLSAPGTAAGVALAWDDVAETVGRYTGRAYAGPGESLVAFFPIPGDAVRCGEEVSRTAGARGCVHVGEVASDGRTARGKAVEVAAHHVSAARPGEVLVTRTVTELCAGSGLRFREHDGALLDPDDARVYVVDPAEQPPVTPAVAERPAEPSPRAPVTRLVVVDDHPLWRQTLAKVIESRRVGTVVGQAGDAATAVALVTDQRPDVVVMDVHLPDESGVAATRRIVASSPETRVLMLSSSDEPEDVLAAVTAGASGYLLKTAESRDIAEAVRRVASGELVFPPALATVVLDALRERAGPREQPTRPPI
ncbi:MAG TPA: response regulator [Mycobacteriales bacterium]|nr:response regulator [Mycobacteriales bacterium]